MSKLNFIFNILFNLLAFSALAQLQNFNFEHIDDLPNSPNQAIYKIYEDTKGFLWLGTINGLYRYDGYSFQIIHHNILDSNAMSHPTVFEIYEDTEKELLWLGTGKGLNRYDRNTGLVKRFYPYPDLIEKGLKERNRIYSILQDTSGKLWLTTSLGIALFDAEAEAFEEIEIDSPSQKFYFFHKLKKDATGQIWCGTQYEMLKIDPIEKKASPIEIDALTQLGKTSYYRESIIETRGDFWFSLNQDIVKFDPVSKKATKINLPSHDQKRVYNIFKDHSERLWVSFSRGNLAVYDQKIQQSALFNYDPTHPSRFFEGGILTLQEDYSGNIWIGTASGLWKVSPRDFEHILNVPELYKRPNEVKELVEDSNGFIYASSIDGIFRHSPDRREIIKIPFNINGEKNYLGGLHLFIDQDNSLWASLAHSKAISVFRCEAGESVLHNLNYHGNLSVGGVYKIIQDSNNPDFLWMGTSFGLCHVNKKTKEWVVYKPKEDLPDLPFDRLRYLDEENDVAIWTYYPGASALGRFDLESKSFSLFRPPSELAHTLAGELRSFLIDDNRNIWIATSNGLTRFDIQQEQFFFYTTKDGLPENNLHGALPDTLNRLWIISSTSISQFSLEEKVIKQFFADHDLKRLSNVHTVNPDGLLLLGGINGFYRLNPKKINQNLVPPKIALVDFKVADKSFDLGSAPETVKKIQLSSRENSITFEFAALHYLEPGNNLYKCQLVGFDEDWRELGKERKVTYTNLQPDQYVFKVKASNSDGIWNEEGLVIDLVITPVMWQTNWFKALIVLLLLAIAYMVIRNRQHQASLKHEKELAEQSAKYKSQFLANISHEIRTPMNAIIGLSNLMGETELTEKQDEYTSAINQSSKNLLSIINDLLDHAKIESGKFTFSKKAFDLEESINQLYNTLIFNAKEKGLLFATKIEEDVPKGLIGDPVRLQQILLNLTGNALKFTEKGEVMVSVAKKLIKENKVELWFKVSDTGVGIAKEKLKMIFESFKQADEEVFAKYGGTGLGLSIAKELVEQQGGTLSIKSQVGKGTTLQFYLPFELASLPESKQPESKAAFEFSNLNILLVEDTYFNQVLAIELLKKKIEGVQIDVADNGKIALEKLSNNTYDIVLMDVKMPVMDGFEATKAIRSLENEKNQIPILALTANAVPEQLEKCKMVGMDDYVTKPINGEELFGKMQSILQNSQK